MVDVLYTAILFDIIKTIFFLFIALNNAFRVHAFNLCTNELFVGISEFNVYNRYVHVH